jgi:Transglutaminase-like superfamily
MSRSPLPPCRRLMSWLPAALVLVGGTHARAQQESWDAIYLGGAKIGYVHTYVQTVEDKGREYIRVRLDIRQDLKRDRDTTVVQLQYGTIETSDGKVLRLDTRTRAGDDHDIRAHGDVIDGKMKLVLEGTDERQEMTIPWGPDVRGPYAAEQSMAKKPLKELEERPLKMYMPELNKVCDIVLHARKIQPTLLGDGAMHSLLRVDQTTKVGGKPVPQYDTTLWVDNQGQVLKGEQDVMGGLVMFRTTKEAALSPAGPVKFDLIKDTVIKVGKSIPDAEKTRMVKYRVSLKDGDLAQTFPADSRQSVEHQSSTDVLEVKSAGPLDGEPGPTDVDRQYLAPNVLITSKDRNVSTLARQATRGASLPWQKVVRINHWVFENITDKNFTVAFAAANEVARNRSGDCTEHAVLAAAMCRAVGIPARVVVGMVYVEKLQGFGFHMWDEVYINQRWIAIDPTWDQTMVDAVHIKLAESSLEGVTPFEMFLPLLRVAGKLSIEPLELR